MGDDPSLWWGVAVYGVNAPDVLVILVVELVYGSCCDSEDVRYRDGVWLACFPKEALKASGCEGDLVGALAYACDGHAGKACLVVWGYCLTCASDLAGLL